MARFFNVDAEMAATEVNFTEKLVLVEPSTDVEQLVVDIEGGGIDKTYIALKLLEHQPKLSVIRDVHKDIALHVLARKLSSLFARKRIGIFKRLAYSS
ncbi:hypothetical protein Q3G72_029569 [Acer saccharum]|nr:hypothetical protein Q3G72_029569 [Acer saccharum]